MSETPAAPAVPHRDTPTRRVTAGGTTYAHRVMGPSGGVPLVLFGHLSAVLDDWDPRVLDGLAARRRVITVDLAGVGASTGRTPSSIEAMAVDAVAFVRALGLERVDLLGLSMGGFVAQLVAAAEPRLVRRLVLAGTGPAGGEGITAVTRLSNTALLRGALTRRDPKTFLFYPPTPAGRRVAREVLARMQERTQDRDAPISLRSYAAQLRAVRRWARAAPADLTRVLQPTLVVNGDADVMVPTANSVDLARRIPGAALELYPDAGHGGIFQHHDRFVATALDFLAD